MQVNSTQSVTLLTNTSGETDDLTPAAVSINRAIAVGVTVLTDITTAGEATIAILGYDGTNWITLDSQTKDADSNYEAWNRTYPAYTQIKATATSITGNIAISVELNIVS